MLAGQELRSKLKASPILTDEMLRTVAGWPVSAPAEGLERLDMTHG